MSNSFIKNARCSLLIISLRNITIEPCFILELCKSLDKNIYLPKTIHTIDAGAFANCKDLNNIHIDDLAKFGSIQFIGRYSNPLDQGFFMPNLIVNGINLRERGFNIDFSYDFNIAGNYGNYNMSISQNYPTEAILQYDKANHQDYAYYKDWRVDDLINNYYSNNIKTVEIK